MHNATYLQTQGLVLELSSDNGRVKRIRDPKIRLFDNDSIIHVTQISLKIPKHQNENVFHKGLLEMKQPYKEWTK